MRAKAVLPENYDEIFAVDLQNDKKLALRINVAAFLIAAVMVVCALFAVPDGVLFDMSRGYGAYVLRFGVLLVSIVAYTLLHELVHGAAMKIFGCRKVKYGFTGMYAFAGCDDYFDKGSYLVIALAPVVLLGIVLAVLNAVVPTEYFWVVYIVQITNVSGAAGDLYVTWKFIQMPKDILVHDSGVSMQVYSAAGQENE